MSDKKIGHYIAIEGNEGTGKTTQLDALVARLTEAGHEVVRVREPGGTPFAEELRAKLKLKSDDALTVLSELLMFGAARDDLYAKVVGPALTAGKVVVADRCYFSTYALQVHPFVDGRPLLMQLFNIMTGANCEQLNGTPIIVVNLELDEEERQRRLEARGGSEVDSFESRDPEYQAKVIEAYGMLPMQPGVLSFSGAQEAEVLTDQIFDQVQVAMNQRLQELEIREQQTQAATTEEADAATPSEDEQKAAEPVSHDEIEGQMLVEVNRHAVQLEEMFKGDFGPMRSNWEIQVANVNSWVKLHMAELREKDAKMNQQQVAQYVAQLGGNIGQMLASFLSLQNIAVMVKEKTEETLKPAEDEPECTAVQMANEAAGIAAN